MAVVARLLLSLVLLHRINRCLHKEQECTTHTHYVPPPPEPTSFKLRMFDMMPVRKVSSFAPKMDPSYLPTYLSIFPCALLVFSTSLSSDHRMHFLFCFVFQLTWCHVIQHATYVGMGDEPPQRSWPYTMAVKLMVWAALQLLFCWHVILLFLFLYL